MAEIKSTMEKVMERAARMGGGGAVETDREEKTKQGMRLAAAFLRGELEDLNGRITAAPEADRPFLRRGAVRTLLRNIVLPREASQLQPAEKAMEGLVALGEGDSQLLMLFGDLKKILDQYLQHRTQLKGQLESQFRQQVEMMEQNLAQQTGMAMKLEPSQHPKFQEEWQRIESELNDQYGRAVEQHKALVSQRLGG